MGSNDASSKTLMQKRNETQFLILHENLMGKYVFLGNLMRDTFQTFSFLIKNSGEKLENIYLEVGKVSLTR
jgi:hypothetical protein